MPNTCGNRVYTARIKWWLSRVLSTLVVPMRITPGYKSRTFTPRFARLIHQLTHSFFAQFTEVIPTVFPTIHTTNKNYKNFLNKFNITYIDESWV